MNYFELRKIFDETETLPYNRRSKAFSDGVQIISENVYSDFPYLMVSKRVNHIMDEEYNVILYGSIQEVLDTISDSSAKRLAELGWAISDEMDEEDDYFKFRL